MRYFQCNGTIICLRDYTLKGVKIEQIDSTSGAFPGISYKINTHQGKISIKVSINQIPSAFKHLAPLRACLSPVSWRSWTEKKIEKNKAWHIPSPKQQSHFNGTWTTSLRALEINELAQRNQRAWQPETRTKQKQHRKGKEKSNIPSFQPNHFVLIFMFNAKRMKEKGI